MKKILISVIFIFYYVSLAGTINDITASLSILQKKLDILHTTMIDLSSCLQKIVDIIEKIQEEEQKKILTQSSKRAAFDAYLAMKALSYPRIFTNFSKMLPLIEYKNRQKALENPFEIPLGWDEQLTHVGLHRIEPENAEYSLRYCKGFNNNEIAYQNISNACTSPLGYCEAEEAALIFNQFPQQYQTDLSYENALTKIIGDPPIINFNRAGQEDAKIYQAIIDEGLEVLRCNRSIKNVLIQNYKDKEDDNKKRKKNRREPIVALLHPTLLPQLMAVLSSPEKCLPAALVLLTNGYWEPSFLRWLTGAILWNIKREGNYGNFANKGNKFPFMIVASSCFFSLMSNIKNIPDECCQAIFEACNQYKLSNKTIAFSIKGYPNNLPLLCYEGDPEGGIKYCFGLLWALKFRKQYDTARATFANITEDKEKFYNFVSFSQELEERESLFRTNLKKWTNSSENNEFKEPPIPEV